MNQIPINNEGDDESSNPQPTPEKGVVQGNKTIQQLEAALRELLERVTESQDHTWKSSTVETKEIGREKSKHPFSPHILAKELPKKFRYLVEIEPYDGTTDPKHHLDAFKTRCYS
ncbi:hypothetical protein PIB30_085117 [Stylosanthes scabra]|uniref:Reverse transcriptase domain-containing protein n=1 Tax=Stylosanthes scabra TaxID=79078 RepID=A0ABU6WTR2_9FABA|nr:hypothetical protein [Stylosanthes scabra]